MCHTIIIGDVQEYSRLRVKEKLHIFLGEKIRAQNIKMNKYAALVWMGKVLNSRVILMKEFYKVCLWLSHFFENTGVSSGLCQRPNSNQTARLLYSSGYWPPVTKALVLGIVHHT